MKFVPAFVLVMSLIQVAFSRPAYNEGTDSNIDVTGNDAPSDGPNTGWSKSQSNKIAHRNVPISQMDQKQEKAGLLIYAKGNAANLALAESGSEAQAAENDQNSKYNIQQIGIESFSNEYEEDLIDE